MNRHKVILVLIDCLVPKLCPQLRLRAFLVLIPELMPWLDHNEVAK